MYKVFILFLLLPLYSSAQLKWKNVDSLFQPLPSSVHVYFTNDSLDGKPNIAYYVAADLKDKKLDFTTDTTKGRRLTPAQFYQRDKQPLVVVNCTFFEFTHNSNLNLVMRNGKVIAPNQQAIPMRGKDTLKYAHVFPSAIGISKKRNADVAWTFTPDNRKKPWAIQFTQKAIIDSASRMKLDSAIFFTSIVKGHQGDLSPSLYRWKMQTAVGGGPVLLQNGEVNITNNEERKFGGKAINDKHPRTAIGYTTDGRLIILVIQGRFPNIAEGATLVQEAQIFKALGCWEALNLDGGGSSCLLVNGKETIKPSDKEGERPVPAVFMIKAKK
jgi:exopolysaccharide biosynthesis protein